MITKGRIDYNLFTIANGLDVKANILGTGLEMSIPFFGIGFV